MSSLLSWLYAENLYLNGVYVPKITPAYVATHLSAMQIYFCKFKHHIVHVLLLNPPHTFGLNLLIPLSLAPYMKKSIGAGIMAMLRKPSSDVAQATPSV
jgi:hypothetical protein